jgi:hypothetical protein
MKKSIHASSIYERTLPFVVIAEPESYLPFLEQGKIAMLPPCVPCGKPDAMPFDRIGYWG